MNKVSIIIPCKNEQHTIGLLLDDIISKNIAKEIIVVNDGSTDETATVLEKYDIIIINNIYSKGNGAAVKAGARQATQDTLVFMDADGQHSANDVLGLLKNIDDGYDMVIGARDGQSQASAARHFGNRIYNKLASLITGHKIKDLTSGFRAVRRSLFLEFMPLYPNGFSYPTTITMAFFRSGYSVKYIPISLNKRIGTSHLSLLKDGIGFLLIIFKVSTLYSPLKLFAPLSALIFSFGISHYIYTYAMTERFTNMSLLLLATGVFVFIFGLISEQITMLIYLNISNKNK